MTHRTANGDRIWIIEEDSTHTPGVLVNRNTAHSIFGDVVVQREGDTDTDVWAKRNIIDHSTGERMQ